MSSNSDNQMTRFLFAILKQKNLKDIDWNAVARDPILPQPITNGHAARMRYSRFRSSMLGIEPQKRNRNPTSSKNKVTKSKKDTKPATKKEEERDDPVKPEPGLHSQSAFADYQSRMRIKHELSQNPYEAAQFTPTSPAGPESLRLLTPCSDDMLSVPHNIQFSPQPTLLSGFDHMATESCGHGHEDHDGTEPGSWAASPMFPPFDYHLHTYAIPDMASMFPRPDAGGDGMQPGQVEVKNEQWDA